MKIVSMALRSLTRNPVRTSVTIGAMAMAGTAMIFYASLMEGFSDTLERNMVTMSLGDIQIHAQGYRNDPDLYKRIDNVDALINKLDSAGFYSAPRLYGFGLAAGDSTSAGVLMTGVDVEREKLVTRAHLHLLAGSWLDRKHPSGVVTGRKLARTLNVKVGDELVIVSQAGDGSMANDLYIVRGILKSIGEKTDRGGFFMLDTSFRELMAVPNGAHEIAVMRKDRREDISSATGRARAIAGGLETKNWRELQPVIARLIDVSDAGVIIMTLIVYAAIAMVTLNAMLMNVFERIREFGVMKAIGVSPGQMMALVYVEAAVQAGIACALALAGGASLSLYFQSHGVDLAVLTSDAVSASIGGVAFDPVWYPVVTLSTLATPLVTLAVIVALAVIYPGMKAAMIKPVEAIHYQ